MLRLGLPLVWLRRELPELRLQRVYVTRARMRDLVGVSWSNFLVHVANKVVFSTDVVVVGIVLGAERGRDLRDRVEAVPASRSASPASSRRCSTRRSPSTRARASGSDSAGCCSSGLRGGSAAALVLALPLLLIPANLIHAWVGDGFSESAPVLALLALVLLVHQPVWMLTQYLIARGRQREIARLLIVGAAANLVLSVVMALTVGTWGVALATLLVDVAVLAAAIPLSVGAVLPGCASASSRARCCGRCCRRSATAVLVFGIARSVGADTQARAPPVRHRLGACSRSAAVWRLGLTADERRSFSRQIGRGGGGAPPALVET